MAHLGIEQTTYYMSIRVCIVMLLVAAVGEMSAQSTKKISYDFNDFDRLHISGDFVVNYTQTDGEESFELKVSKHLIDKVKVYEEDNVLYLSHVMINNWRAGNVLVMNIRTNRNLAEIRVSGDSKLYLKSPLKQDKLSIFISSDSEIHGILDIQELAFKSNSDGRAYLVGEVGKLIAQLNSDANLEAFKLKVKTLDIKLGSDAMAELTVTDELSAVVTSDARLTYRGNPRVIKQKINSDGRIRRVN